MPEDQDRLHFESLNVYTGMIESEEDMRKAALDMARTFQDALRHPMLQFLLPPELYMNSVSYAVKMESLFRPMSQAEQWRKIMEIEAVDPITIAMWEQTAGGMSETLPATHPEARRHVVRTLVERGYATPEQVRQEYGEDAEALLAPDTSGPTEPLPELPSEIEKFLRSLGIEGPNNEGDKKHGDEGDGTRTDN